MSLVPVTDLGPQPGDLITGKAGLTLAILAAMLILVVSGLASLGTASVIAAVALTLTQGAPPEPFAIATAFAVLAGYVTLLTDGDNLFVHEAGQYSMRDYVINGLPIYILQTITLLLMLTFFYGLI